MKARKIPTARKRAVIEECIVTCAKEARYNEATGEFYEDLYALARGILRHRRQGHEEVATLWK